jgi:putative membrane protein
VNTAGLAHGGHSTSAADAVVPLLITVVLACGYVVLVTRQHARAQQWNAWRTTAFLTGCATLAVALPPDLSPYPATDFRGHMLQHLLVGMVAPTCLALGAPMSLLLRSVPVHRRRLAAAILRSRGTHVLTHPATVVTLTVGGLVALYATPLADVVDVHPALHHLVHLHFLVSGYLFAWLIAGPDPAPRRPGVPARLVLLGVVIAAHTVLSQLMYAGALGDAEVPTAERQGAATLMYYGGDVAELALAAALVSSWRPDRRLGTGGQRGRRTERTSPTTSAARTPDGPVDRAGGIRRDRTSPVP